MPRGDTDSVPTVAPILCITGSRYGSGIHGKPSAIQILCTEITIHNPGNHDQPYGVRLFVLNNPLQWNPIEVHSVVNKHISRVCLMTYLLITVASLPLYLNDSWDI